jgi:hypothetical protein
MPFADIGYLLVLLDDAHAALRDVGRYRGLVAGLHGGFWFAPFPGAAAALLDATHDDVVDRHAARRPIGAHVAAGPDEVLGELEA